MSRTGLYRNPLPRKRGRVRVGVMRPSRTDMRGGQPMKTRARQLRGNLTEAERVLWRELRQRQLGWRFRRQFPIPPYIADFACVEARLIVEADGGQHARPADHDHRDAILRVQGWRILRFWNNEILENPAGVLQTIAEMLGVNPHPDPPPLAGEGVSAATRHPLSPPVLGDAAQTPRQGVTTTFPPPQAGDG